MCICMIDTSTVLNQWWFRKFDLSSIMWRSSAIVFTSALGIKNETSEEKYQILGIFSAYNSKTRGNPVGNPRCFFYLMPPRCLGGIYLWIPNGCSFSVRSTTDFAAINGMRQNIVTRVFGTVLAAPTLNTQNGSFTVLERLGQCSRTICDETRYIVLEQYYNYMRAIMHYYTVICLL